MVPRMSQSRPAPPRLLLPDAPALIAGLGRATLLTPEKVTIRNVPAIVDVMQLIELLRQDEAIAEADTLLLTVPNQLGVAYNAHVIETILTHIAPALGWR